MTILSSLNTPRLQNAPDYRSRCQISFCLTQYAGQSHRTWKPTVVLFHLLLALLLNFREQFGACVLLRETKSREDAGARVTFQSRSGGWSHLEFRHRTQRGPIDIQRVHNTCNKRCIEQTPIRRALSLSAPTSSLDWRHVTSTSNVNNRHPTRVSGLRMISEKTS